MIVYMAGPINGCNDDEAHGWRQSFDAKMCSVGITTLDPMRRDYRGREDECVDEIIEGDKKDIFAADVFFAYCWQVSWGTAMEIHFAWLNHKPVILAVPKGQPISPWLRYHSTSILPSLDAATTAIAARYGEAA